MNFEDEPYVRIYKRRTVTIKLLGWEGRAVFRELLLEVDRSGVLDLGDESPAQAVAALTDIPLEIVEVGMARAIKLGAIEVRGRALLVPRFMEAQEAKQSDKIRQRESRARRAAEIRLGLDLSPKERIVYFLRSEHGGPVKIGISDDLAKRLVNIQSSRPDKVIVLAQAPGTVEDERSIHARFWHLHESGEWFQATDELLAYIKSVAKSRSLVTPGDVSQPVTCHTVSPSDQLSSAELSRAEEGLPTVDQPRVSKPRAAAKPRQVPVPMSEAVEIPEALIEAKAEAWGVAPDVVRSKVKEFRLFWSERGDRRTPANWARTFAHRIDSQGKNGFLHKPDPSSVVRLRPVAGNSIADMQRRQQERIARLEAEEEAARKAAAR